MQDKQHLQPVKGKMIEQAFLQSTAGVTETDRMLAGEDKTEIPDDRLISATLKGDDEAFALLVGRYKRRWFSLAARFAGNRDELEDISQEVFIKA